MKKKVNITPAFPIYTIVPPIVGSVKKMEMSTGDIARCIYRRAIVDEVLDDGSLVRLDLSNYDKDNSKSEKKRKAEDEDEEEAKKKKLEQEQQDELQKNQLKKEKAVSPDPKVAKGLEK